MKNIIQIGLGLGLLYYGVLRGAKALVVRVKSFSFAGVNPDTMSVGLTLNLLIKNPLLIGLRIKGVQGDVYAQGHKVGTVNTAYDYYIAGGKTHILPVLVDLNMSDVGQAALMNIQTGDIRTLTISFDGRIYVGNKGIAIPVQFDFDYNDLTK